MLARFLHRLTAPAPVRPDASQAALALSALLVRVARADGDYSASEAAGIETILARRYSLAPEAAADLRREGEAMEASASDAVRFTRVLKDTVPLEVRTELIEALWEVALADGSRGHDEAATLRLMSGLLGITDLESGLARQRVQARLGGATAS